MTVKFNNNRELYDDLSKPDNHIDDQDYVTIEYPDFYSNNGKKITSKNLGEKFASINSFFLEYLKGYHIPSGFLKIKQKNALKFVKYNKLPFTLKIINRVDKRTAKIFSKHESEILNLPIFEYHFGNSKDSLITESHLISFDLCSNEDLKIIGRIVSKINAVLKSYFERRNLIFAEVSCVFGKADNKICLVGNFTPESIKVFSTKDNSPDPYQFNTAKQIRNYTDFLNEIVNG